MVLSLIYCLVNIGSGSLRDWDEATYAQVAKEIVQNHQWLTLLGDDMPFFEKPPLVIWFTAFCYSIWGICEWSVRFGSALCGIGSILVTYLFSRKLFGSNVGLVAALVLLGMPHFIAQSKIGMFDAPLTLFITLTLFFYIKGLSSQRWFLASGAAFGIAFMIKDIAACMAPFVIIMYMLIYRDFKPLRSPYLWIGVVLSFIIIAPWHIVQVYRFGDRFLEEYFMYHVVERGTSAIGGHPSDPFYYFGVMLKEARPWLLQTIIAIPYCVIISLKERNRDTAFFVCWALSVFAIASAFKTKIDWYILPIYPALAVCNAIMLIKLLPARHFSKILTGCLVIIILNGIFCHRIFDLDYKPEIKAIATHIKREVPENSTLYIYKVNQPSVRFYGERVATTIKDDEPLPFEMTPGLVFHVLTRKQYLGQLNELLSGVNYVNIATQKDYVLLKLTNNDIW